MGVGERPREFDRGEVGENRWGQSRGWASGGGGGREGTRDGPLVRVLGDRSVAGRGVGWVD